MRPTISRRSRPRSDLADYVPWIERVAQPVADEVDRDHREEDEEPGEERDPRRLVHVGGRVVQHVAPRRRGWLDAQAEERERALGDDRATDTERTGDDDRRERVGEDVPEDDPAVARADAARGLDELALLERQERRT